jgi:hypothetical protein
MMSPGPRKPRRIFSALAAACGVALLVFEIRRFRGEGPEAWFWIAIAALMITMGLIGVFQRPPRK